MSDIDQLFSKIPIDQIATKLKLKDDVARVGVAAALPALLHGMAANAKDTDAAASLLKALQTKDASLIASRVNLADIDAKDGKKIVQHVFGKATPQVAARLGKTTGTGTSKMKKLLPLLAPLIMALIAKKMSGGSAKTQPKATGSGGLGDILGGILGGGGGGGLGNILGGILGGGSSSGSGGGLGGLGDLLGGLLGGGTR